MIDQTKRSCMQKQGNKSDNELIYVDWSGLPRAILEMIFERLTLIECRSISAVCVSWRNVFASELSCWQGLGFPSLLMSGQKERKMRTCVSMLEKRAWEMELPEAQGKFFWGSFHDWLIMVDAAEYFSVNISLLNPFTRIKLDLPNAWNFYHKMVLSGLPFQQNLICMLVHDQFRELAFWVEGASSWLELKLDGEPFEDAVFCNGSFYLLSKDSNNIWQVDGAIILNVFRKEGASASEICIQLHEINMPKDRTNHGLLRYLVESCGEVLLISRFFCTIPSAVLETHLFEVDMLDISHKSWNKVDNLGDRILFIGKCSSRSFSSTELGVETKNSIYFSNDQVNPWLKEWDSDHLKGMASRNRMDNKGRKDWGIFNLGDKDNWRYSFRGNRDVWGPIWITAPLWWYCKRFA